MILTFLKRLFSLPAIIDENPVRARLMLYILGLQWLAVGVGWLIALAVRTTPMWLEVVVGTVVTLVTHALFYTGRLRAAQYMLTLSVWAALSLVVFLNNGVMVAANVGYFVVLVIASLLVDEKTTLGLMAASMVVIVGGLYITVDGVTRTGPPDQFQAINSLASVCALLIVTALVLLAARLMQDAVTRLNVELIERRRFETSLRQSREKMDQAYRVKSEFLITLGQELRAPLATLTATSAALVAQAQAAGQMTHSASLNEIHAISTRLSGILQDVHDLSNLEAGRWPVQIGSVLLAEVIADLEREYVPLLANSGNQLVIQNAASLAEIRSDAAVLRHAAGKLLRYANRATQTGPITLTVSTPRLDGALWLHLRVHYTNVGLSPEQLAQLFRPFASAEAALADPQGDSGLGLAISRSLCRTLQGDVALDISSALENPPAPEGSAEQGMAFIMRVPLDAS